MRRGRVMRSVPVERSVAVERSSLAPRRRPRPRSGPIERLRRGVRLAGAGAALALSCQAVLGIEDLSEQPRPIAGGAGAGGASGETGSGGSDSGAGAGIGGVGGSGLAGASSTPDAGDGLAGAGGGLNLPDAGTPGEPGDLVVSGHVIDFFRRPVPNVPVSIGGSRAVTDALGAFTIRGVAPPYDASLTLNTTRDNVPARYGYVYEGLTRNDPTLQVYSALIQRNSSSFAVAVNNAEFDAEANRRVILAFSSPDGRFVDESITSDAVAFVGGIEWTGPLSTSGVAHALRVIGSDSFDGSPPIVYESHQVDGVDATDGEIANASFDMADSFIPTDIIAGAPNGGSLGERSNYVALRFEDGTALPLIDESNPDIEFVYEVPALENTSLVVAAADGSAAFPPYSVAWRDEVAPDDVAVELLIPNPVTPTAPPSGSSVDGDTTFTWSTVGQTAQTFVWHLESNGPTYEGMFVITARTQLQLPAFSDGFALAPGTPFVWSVETHGAGANVDALTGPNGFLDPFSLSESFPVGPGRGGGYYTESLRNPGSLGGG